MKRFLIGAGSACACLIIASQFLGVPIFGPNLLAAPEAPETAKAGDRPEGHAHGEAGHDEEEAKPTEGKIEMTPERVAAAKISTGIAASGVLSRRLSFPAVIVPDRFRVGRVPAKVVGTVAELAKRLGDPVERGEVVAVLESREVADAKSEYIAARVNFELQGTLYEREKTLWEKQVTAEQRLLKARATQQEAQVRRDLARQKLLALGVSEKEITALSADGENAIALQRYEIKAPIAGRIVEQLVDIGTPVGGEGQAKELYAITDLSVVWVELTVSTTDLSQIREGQRVLISANGGDEQTLGAIILISPMLDQDTRSARVIASAPNKKGAWRPGMFVTAEVAVAEKRAKLVVPKKSVQTLNNEPSVFVRTPTGFEARRVDLGEDDGSFVEIVTGLELGEEIATSNTFLLKADVGKSEAGHAH